MTPERMGGTPEIPDEEHFAQAAREKALDHIPREMHEQAIETLLTDLDTANFKLRKTNEENAERIAALQEKAARDGLTKLLNREAGSEIIRDIVSTGNGGALLMLDIDRFKNINDSYGHAVGDEALQAAAKYLLGACRPTDVICRWGGEEILIFFPDATTADIAKKFTAEKDNLPRIEIPFDYPNETLDGKSPIESKIFTFSGGITELKPSGDTLESAITRADKTMYAAKNNEAHPRNHLEIAANQQELPELES